METLKTAYEPKTQTQTWKCKLESTQANPIVAMRASTGPVNKPVQTVWWGEYQLSINSSRSFISYFCLKPK